MQCTINLSVLFKRAENPAMAFRYRVIFYHENQNWVPKVSPLLDIPIFHLSITDSEAVMQKQLANGDVDILITGIDSKNFQLVQHSDGSTSFKKTNVWDNIQNQKRDCKIILLCTQQELMSASELVHSGKIADYCLVSPLLDKSRLFITIMKTLQEDLFREYILKREKDRGRIPRQLFESIEALQLLMEGTDFDQAPPSLISAEKASPSLKVDEEADLPAETKLKNQQQDNTSAVKAMASEAKAKDETLSAFSASNDQPPLKTGQFYPKKEHEDEEEPLDLFLPKAKFGESEYLMESEPAKLSDLFPDEEDDMMSQLAMLKSELTGEPPETPKEDKVAKGGFVGEGVDRDLLTNNWSRMKKSDSPVLLIENDKTSATLIKTILNHAHYKVLTVNSAEEGLFQLNRELFELLIIQQEMPDHRGSIFVRKLRTRGPQYDIPAIILMENEDEQQAIQRMNINVECFVMKPFNPNRLVSMVKAVL